MRTMRMSCCSLYRLSDGSECKCEVFSVKKFCAITAVFVAAGSCVFVAAFFGSSSETSSKGPSVRYFSYFLKNILTVTHLYFFKPVL